MKQFIFTGVLVLAGVVAGEAMADCSTSQVTALGALLFGNTVCDATATYDTCTKHPGSGCVVTMGIQEEHLGAVTGGDLWDYKLGGAPSVDPRRKVGTWSVATDSSTDATVSYIYDQFGPATTAIPYKVYSTGGANYDFCTVGGSPVASVTLVTGTNVGCP